VIITPRDIDGWETDTPSNNQLQVWDSILPTRCELPKPLNVQQLAAYLTDRNVASYSRGRVDWSGEVRRHDGVIRRHDGVISGQ